MKTADSNERARQIERELEINTRALWLRATRCPVFREQAGIRAIEVI